MVRDTRFVRGAEKLSQRIATIRQNYKLPAMVDEIGDLLLKRTKERFNREVDPDGAPWAPLTEETLRRKGRLGFADKGKLKRTEALYNAIRKIRGGAGTTFSNTGAGVRIGVDDPKVVPYATVQNNGNGRIPARRFLGIGALDVKAVDSYMRRQAAKMEKL